MTWHSEIKHLFKATMDLTTFTQWILNISSPTGNTSLRGEKAQCADAWIFMGRGRGGGRALPLLPSLADPLGCLTEYTRLGPQELPSSFSFLTRGLCSERLGDCSGRHSVFRARWGSSGSFVPSSLEPFSPPPVLQRERRSPALCSAEGHCARGRWVGFKDRRVQERWGAAAGDGVRVGVPGRGKG